MPTSSLRVASLVLIVVTVGARVPAQSLSWFQEIDGLRRVGDGGARVAVVQDAGQEFRYFAGSVSGRLPGAVPAIPGLIPPLDEPASSDLFLRKLDALGNTLWTIEYPMTNTLENSVVFVGGIAADAEFVYVGGGITHPGTLPGQIPRGGNDFFVASFSAATGALVQVSLLGSEGSTESITDLAIDATGIVVVGSSNGDLLEDPGIRASGGSRPAMPFVSRFTREGLGHFTHQWTDQFELPLEGGHVGVQSVAIGPLGDIYVGFDENVPIMPLGQRVAAAVRRYSPSGSLLATRSIDLGNGSSQYTRCVDVLALPSGIYVATHGTWGVYLGHPVARLDPECLADMWSPDLHVVQSATVTRLELDGSRLAIVGHLRIGASLAPFGSIDRVDLLTGAMEPRQTVAVSGLHGVYDAASSLTGLVVAGGIYGSPFLDEVDLFLMNVTSAGGTMVNLVQTFAPSTETATALDCDGNIYVLFESDGIVDPEPLAAPVYGRDAYLRKLDAGGATLWTRSAGTIANEKAFGVAVDETGIYVAVGVTALPLQGESAPVSTGFAIRRFSESGAVLWTRRLAINESSYNPTSTTHGITDLAVFEGFLFITGFTRRSVGGATEQHPSGTEVFVARMQTTTGALDWVRQIYSGSDTYGAGVTADASGVYVSGWVRNSAVVTWPGWNWLYHEDAYLLKLDPTGQTILWIRQKGTALAEIATDVAVGTDGVYFSGHAPVSGGWTPSSFLLRCHPTTGAVTGSWLQGTSGFDYVTDLHVEGGAVFFAGMAQGTLPGNTSAGSWDAFAGRLGSAPGTVSWATQFGTSNQDAVAGLGVCETCVAVAGTAAGNAFVAKIEILDQPPTAVASTTDPEGPFGIQPFAEVQCHSAVTLFGTASSDDNTLSSALHFAWSVLTRPAGSEAIIVGADTATASFVPDLVGTYVIELVVTDSLGQSSAPSTVTVSSSNLPPIARAGDDRIAFVGQTISLDGTASSDPNPGDAIISYVWTGVAPDLTPVMPAPGVPGVATHIPTAAGTYRFTLQVTDLCGYSSTDSVDVLVLTSADYAQTKILSALGIVDGLPAGSITSPGNQNAFEEFLRIAVGKIESSDPVQARAKILDALQRTDGCHDRGIVDGQGPGMDWITECATQVAVYALLQDALAALTVP